MVKNISSPYCSKDCPFLDRAKIQGSDKIPYHCDLFNCFLAFEKDILRCEECFGRQLDVKNQGLKFINAYPAKCFNKQMTKLGFSKSPDAVQNRMVHFLKTVGKAIGISKTFYHISQKDIRLMSQYFLSEIDNYSPSKPPVEDKSVTELRQSLKKNASNMPRELDAKTATLIVNIFKVLDNTEKKWLSNTINSPAKFEKFLKKFKSLPQNDSLLKNVRHILEDEEKEDEKQRQEIRRKLQHTIQSQRYIER